MATSRSLPGILSFAILVPCWSGTIPCGDHAGPHCSNAFVEARCDSKDGACCHDDFNAWCCPHNYKCSGVFHDPGGNTHCMTTEKMSGSCLCEQTDYEIVNFEPQGEPQVDDSWDTSLQACCQYPTQTCGWTSTITKTDSQQVSWSNTAEVGFHMTWNVEPAPAMKLGEIGFEVKDSFTYGQTTSTSNSQAYTSGCTCDADHCKGPFTALNYKLKLVSSTLKVKISARKCGQTKVLDGEVKTHQFQGKYDCLINNVKKCDPTSNFLNASALEMVV
eukprot:TRINITY_DN112417_c0_g1_i1.p1 TRINITY_DN112417_c0_g1~~TRINITY_DN112417_c0_g1_i1.p1  ORF type:complete len:300 (-),score=38.09 TRINITY_DN112417_c0_g1_i1:201-1025(-)